MRDEEMWMWWGNYGISALVFAIEHCLAGRNAKTRYIGKPIMQEVEENVAENKPMTEEEKKKQTEALFMKLRIMGANFNLNKEKEQE